jgi:hypothetical protein
MIPGDEMKVLISEGCLCLRNTGRVRKSEERQNDFDDATDERSANSYPDKKIELDNEFAETLYEDPSGSYREPGAIYSEMNSSNDFYQLTSGTVALTIAAAIFLL